MADSLLSLGNTSDLTKRMVSVSNLLLMREQQSQYENSEKESSNLKMTIDTQGSSEEQGSQKQGSTEANEEQGQECGQLRRDDTMEDEDDGGSDCGSDFGGEGPRLRIVMGTPTQNKGESEDGEDENEEEERSGGYDFRQQQLHHYQQRKLQMHQDLTAYNTGSLTVTRFPMNGHQQVRQPSAEKSLGGKFSGLPTINNEVGNPKGTSPNPDCRTGLVDREQISSPQLMNQSTNNPFYFNNNNNNNIPNNNSMTTKGMKFKSNGHSQMTQEDKFQYHSRHGQKRHFSHGQSQSHGQQSQGHDRKLQGGSYPFLSDVKPDMLGSQSQLNTLSRSIGSALLNLASLGNLPTAPSATSAAAALNSGIHLNSSNMTPLNLTSSCAGSPTQTPNANSYLAHYISQHQQYSQLKNSLGNFLPPQTSQILQPGTLPSGTAGSANLPQLILASGNIVQGIQGAQLLIPTSQGLMTQTILTIPITQPASPSSFLSPSPGGKNRPPSEGPAPCPSSPLLNPLLVKHQQPLGGGANHHISDSVNQDTLGSLDRMNLNMGLSRMANGRLDNSTNISAMINSQGGGIPSPMGNICPPQKMSPCSSHSDQDSEFDFDKGSDNDDSDQMVDGINLDEIKEFAKAFKLRRLSLGLTQTQVGQALSVTEGPAYSQSAICSALAEYNWQMAQSNSNRTSIPQSSMFEKLDITPKSAQKIKPVLERWMKEAEDRFKNGHQTLHEFVGMEPSKKRKRRTSFTPQALEILNTHFERNTHPSGAEITTLAHQLGYEREVIRIWFCNKRQALKNTVRMMSKGSSPM